jgi:hypothetical protein
MELPAVNPIGFTRGIGSITQFDFFLNHPTTAPQFGEPDVVLTWLWRRAGDEAVTFAGDASVIRKLWQLLGPATQ